ncbi:hypothetical protein L7F22_045873 [Adiantum nelumboides]|nr:hypothetical protein [Adiantum nelumboides]
MLFKFLCGQLRRKSYQVRNTQQGERERERERELLPIRETSIGLQVNASLQQVLRRTPCSTSPRNSLFLVRRKKPISLKLLLNFTLKGGIHHSLLKPCDKVIHKHGSFFTSTFIGKIKIVNINSTLFIIISHVNRICVLTLCSLWLIKTLVASPLCF